LDHEATLAKSALTAKAYAAERGLSLHAFYQARKRLRALGLLAQGSSKRGTPRAKALRAGVSFSKVELLPPQRSRADFRLSLPGGAVLEWSGAELPAAVVDLVERLTASR
jgi:NAD-dependent oxidoreductase involved in siderophore biosynthesis